MLRECDLAEFVEQLRGYGIRIDVRQYLAANEVLLAFAARGRDLAADAASLAAHLAPIFSTSADEQSLVRDKILSWYEPPPTTIDPPPPDDDRIFRRVLDRVRARLLPLVVVLAACVLVAAAVCFWYLSAHSISAGVSADPIEGRPPDLTRTQVTLGSVPVSVDAYGRFVLSMSRAQNTRTLRVALDGYATQEVAVNYLTPVPLQIHLTPPSVAPRLDFVHPNRDMFDKPVVLGQSLVSNTAAPLTRVPWPMISGAAAAVTLLMLLGLELVDRRRRSLVLKRLRLLGHDPQQITLRPAVGRVADIPPLTLRRLAAGLRRARTQEATSFSIEATVEATARAGGFYTAVAVTRMAMPEYLVLVDRRGPDDQTALIVERWVEQLEQFGLAINRYTFSADPRMCWKPEAPEYRLRLADIVSRHNQASLLLFAESHLCIDPLSGKPWPWVNTLRTLPRCALLTVEPPYCWSASDWSMVRAGFVVLPASADGLQLAVNLGEEWHQPHVPVSYARAYPPLIGGNETRWLDRNPPPDGTVRQLLRQLHGYLGPSGYVWLSACAIYPQISWPITLALNDLLVEPADAVGSRRALVEQLPAICRLPWFRYGYMPDWLRRVCIASYPQTVERAVRERLGEWVYRLFDSTAEVPNATSPVSGSALHLWSTPADLAAAAPAGSPLNDAVFIGFLGGADPDPLALRLRDLPTAVRKSSRPIWRYALGRWRLLALHWPRTLRGSIAVLTGLVAFLVPALRLLQVPQVAPPRPFAVTYPLAPSALDDARTDSPVSLFAVSPDGTLVAYVIKNTGNIDVSSANSPSDGASLTNSPPLAHLAFSPDGTQLAAVARQGPVDIWDVGSGTSRELPIKALNDGDTSVEFARDGRSLVVANSAGITTFDVGDLRAKSSFSFARSDSNPSAVTLSRGGGDFAAAHYQDGMTIVLDSHTGTVIRQLRVGVAADRRMAVSGDGRWLVAGGSDRMSIVNIDLWDLRDPTKLLPREINVSDALDVAFSPDGALLVIREAVRVSLYALDPAQSREVLATIDTTTPTSDAPGPYLAARLAVTAGDPHHTQFTVTEWPAKTNTAPAANPAKEGKSPSAPPNDGNRYWIYLGMRTGNSWAPKYLDFSDDFDPTAFNATANVSSRQFKVRPGTQLNFHYGSFGPAGEFPPKSGVLNAGDPVTIRSIAVYYNSQDWWATIEAPKRAVPSIRRVPATLYPKAGALPAQSPSATPPTATDAAQVNPSRSEVTDSQPANVTPTTTQAPTPRAAIPNAPTPRAPTGLTIDGGKDSTSATSAAATRTRAPLSPADPAQDKPSDTYYVVALTSNSCTTAQAEIERVRQKLGVDAMGESFPSISTYKPADDQCTLLINDTPLPYKNATSLKYRAIEAGFDPGTWLMRSDDPYFEEKNQTRTGQSRK